MKRRLLILLWLLLAVGVGVLWLRSYVATDHLGWWTRQPEGARNPFVVARSSGLFLHRGLIYVMRAEDRVLQQAYEIERQHPPVLLRQSGWISDPASRFAFSEMQFYPAIRYFSVLGFAWGHTGWHSSTAGLPSVSVDYCTVPWWSVAMVLGVWPVRSLVRRLRSRFRERCVTPGLCSTCGYDLRASQERCPECGTPIPSLAGVRASGP